MQYWDNTIIMITLYAAAEPVPVHTTHQPVEIHTTSPVSSPIPISEVPMVEGAKYDVVVAIVASSLAILFFLVVVAVVILAVMVRKAQIGKRVVMLSNGSTSPIDNPSYIIGK